MTIEFECQGCKRTLRVSEGSRGKLCRCPGCDLQLVIPLARIQCRCPKCESTLECDSSLSGTRGCCPTCSNVFTIGDQAASSDSGSDNPTFPFACPRCRQLFEGTKDKEGKKGKCTGCDEVFVIQRYQAPSAVSKMVVASPRPKQKFASPAAVQRLQTQTRVSGPKDDFANLANFLPPTQVQYSAPHSAPYSAPSNLGQFTPPSHPRPSNHHPSKKRKPKPASGLRIAMIVIGSVGAVMFLLCCGGIGLVGYTLTKSSPIASSGYTAYAPGVPVKSSNFSSNKHGEGRASPITRSEFGIMTIGAKSGESVTAAGYIEGLKLVSGLRQESVTAISRAGLSGFRYRVDQAKMVPTHTGEVYDLGSDILVLIYVNGVDVAAYSSKKASMTAERATAWDKPDAFFESLRPSQ